MQRMHAVMFWVAVLLQVSCAVREPVAYGDLPDTETVQVDTSHAAAASRVGVKGLRGCPTVNSCAIVLSPTLSALPVKEPIVPTTISEAVNELVRALPTHYREQLKTVSKVDQYGAQFFSCESTDLSLDYVIDQWLVTAWKLNKPGAMAAQYSTMGEFTPEGIVHDLRVTLCKRLRQ